VEIPYMFNCINKGGAGSEGSVKVKNVYWWNRPLSPTEIASIKSGNYGVEGEYPFTLRFVELVQ
jgi:hypothetical protein